MRHYTPEEQRDIEISEAFSAWFDNAHLSPGNQDEVDALSFQLGGGPHVQEASNPQYWPERSTEAPTRSQFGVGIAATGGYMS